MICPDCKGSKVYQGLISSEPCKTCSGIGEINVLHQTGIVANDFGGLSCDVCFVIPLSGDLTSGESAESAPKNEVKRLQALYGRPYKADEQPNFIHPKPEPGVPTASKYNGFYVMQAEERLKREPVEVEIRDLVTITKLTDSADRAEITRNTQDEVTIKSALEPYGTKADATAYFERRKDHQMDQAVLETAASLLNGITIDEFYQAQADHQRRLAMIELARISIGKEEESQAFVGPLEPLEPWVLEIEDSDDLPERFGVGIEVSTGDWDETFDWDTAIKDVVEAAAQHSTILADLIERHLVSLKRAEPEPEEKSPREVDNEENEDCTGLEGTIPEPFASKLIADLGRGDIILIPLPPSKRV